MSEECMQRVGKQDEDPLHQRHTHTEYTTQQTAQKNTLTNKKFGIVSLISCFIIVPQLTIILVSDNTHMTTNIYSGNPTKHLKITKSV